jgi:hypothetical protein
MDEVAKRMQQLNTLAARFEVEAEQGLSLLLDRLPEDDLLSGTGPLEVLAKEGFSALARQVGAEEAESWVRALAKYAGAKLTAAALARVIRAVHEGGQG